MTGFRLNAQRVAMRYFVAPLAIGAACPPAADAACPDLAGSYMCDYDGDTHPTHALGIRQEIRSGNTVYTFDGSDEWQISFTADGDVHATGDIADMRSSTLKGWCEGDRLKVERKGIFVDADDGKEIGKLALTYAMRLEGDVLVYDTTGLAEVEGQEVPTDETARCERTHD